MKNKLSEAAVGAFNFTIAFGKTSRKSYKILITKILFFTSFKKTTFLLVPILCCIMFRSCKKDFQLDNFPNKIMLDSRFKKPRINFDSIAIPFYQCIFSYDELMAELSVNPIPVSAVILDDGTTIPTGGPIISMTYKAIDFKEGYSLFRSEFKVIYNLYGYQQENMTNCWSLGCEFADAGVPPFTNIRKQNKVLEINTKIIWSIPGGIGTGIKYIVIE